MSLDFYIFVPKEHYYTRENGSTVAYPLEDGQYGEMHVGNITHNLNTIAENVPVSDTLNLYKVLWRPDENNLLITDEIWPLVEEGIRYMLRHKKKLLKFNPDNGWGSYEGLLDFTRKVGAACLFNPHCKVSVSR